MSEKIKKRELNEQDARELANLDTLERELEKDYADHRQEGRHVERSEAPAPPALHRHGLRSCGDRGEAKLSEVKTETYRLSDALVSYVREQQDKLKELARERKEIDAQYAAAVDRVKERFHGTKVELVRHICSIIDVPFDPDDVTKAYAVEVQYLKHGVAFLVVAEEDAPPAPGEMSFYPVSGAPPPKNRLN